MVRCQRRPESRKLVRWHRGRYARAHARRRARHRARQEVLALTPYDCGAAGRFAVPCYIVECESGYSWGAWNPSGALGPYQLLGKGAPWPVVTAADRLEHHRIAAALWAGGAGASHWVCA